MIALQWILRLVIASGLLAGTLLLGRVGISQARESPDQGVAALPAIPFLEALALGYREAASDLAWMQAIQYYGEHRQGGNDLSEFGHFLDVVNTLDPRFEHAYLFGAVVLATDGKDLEGALDVLRRGSRANPASHQFSFQMGFLSYIVGQDLDASQRYFAYAARFPNGRDRALRFRAYLNRRMGQLETAWMLWSDVYQTTTDASLRIVAAESMRKIEAAMEARRR